MRKVVIPLISSDYLDYLINFYSRCRGSHPERSPSQHNVATQNIPPTPAQPFAIKISCKGLSLEPLVEFFSPYFVLPDFED